MKKLLIITVLALLFSGCATDQFKQQSIMGSKIDEGLITGIKKGVTTRSEILKNFGAPDRIIEAGITGTAASSIEGDVNLSTKQNISVGKNQEIYIYEYIEHKREKSLMEVYGFGGGKESIRKNSLMIWIDKDSGIVQDYGYKKEI